MIQSERTSMMKQLIGRLFKECQSPLPDQAPAIECAVTLTGGVITMRGSLSITPEGMLRMLRPDHDSSQNARAMSKAQLLEHFFDYSDVMMITMLRTVTLEPASRIVTT